MSGRPSTNCNACYSDFDYACTQLFGRVTKTLSLFNELKRRNVFKVAIGYVLIAWLIAQVLQLVFESFGTPDWAIKSVLVLLVTGLPIAVFFAWAYEMTPEGLKREIDLDRSQPITPQTIEKLKRSETTVGKLNSMIYKSRCKGLVTSDMVDSILSSSAQNNQTHGITGVLIATETHFLQVLEGEFEAINEAFHRIVRDSRHEKIQLISFTEIEERKFGEWAMHGIGLFDLNREMTIKLRKMLGDDHGNVRLPSTFGEVMELLSILFPEEKFGKTRGT